LILASSAPETGAAGTAVDLAVGAVAVVLAVAAIVQWRRTAWWAPTDPAWWLALTLTSVSATAALFTKTAGRLIADVSGVQGLNEPMARTALMVAVACAPLLLVAVTDPGRLTGQFRRRLLVPAACSVVLWAAFAASPTSSEFTPNVGQRPSLTYLVYTTAYLVALAVTLVEICRGAVRVARTSPPGAVRLSLHLVAVGCVAGGGYVVVRASSAIAYFTPAAEQATRLQAALGRTLAVVAGTMVAVGCLTPTYARLATDARHELWAWRQHHALRPAWDIARAAYPDVVLDQRAARPSVPFVGARHRRRLYRRLVELRDAQIEARDKSTATSPERRRFTDLLAYAPHLDPADPADVQAECGWWLAAQQAFMTSRGNNGRRLREEVA
jgi:hypothetical protein